MIGDSVRTGLRAEGHGVDWVRDGDAALREAGAQPYDLVLLDLGLPRQDGLTVLAELRRRGSTTPVLIITARDAVADRIRGLDAGADDYLVKPFDLDELSARIRALTRRAAGRASAVVTHRGITFDAATREVSRNGVPVALSAKELKLLEALIERPGAILSREQLEGRVYAWGEEVESNAIEVHIHGLRRKLGSEFIRTVRGVGYTLRQET